MSTKSGKKKSPNFASTFCGPMGTSDSDAKSMESPFLEMLKQQPSLSQLSAALQVKLERKLKANWYGKCNFFCPFGDCSPTWDISTIIYPWLKAGDVVLVTGYNRNCQFIEKLGASIRDNGSFFGNVNVQVLKEGIDIQDARLFQCSRYVFVATASNISLDLMLPSNKKQFMIIVEEIKRANNILICSFQDDYEFLREMRCWDSIIEIRRGKRIRNPAERYSISNVRFLRARHLSPRLMKMNYKLITHVPSGRSGYDDSKDMYFINNDTGYEEVKDRVVKLFYLGHTSKEIKEILEMEDKLTISLPLLNKLKREWGLRSYKPERKPRKPKQVKSS